MSPKRIVSLAVLAIAAATPVSLLAQAVSSASMDASSSDTLVQWVPVYLPASPVASVTVPMAEGFSVAPARRSASDFEADIDAAVSQVLYKAPRKHLAEFAMKLKDISYRRGGHEPSTGFDCSGFVHYVYNQTFGLDLPFDAPSQYLDGEKIARADMKTGDLVFFHEGKRITHVGIYLDNGRFIHSPSPGKRVRVDELASPYWVKRFAGARRPHVLS